MIIQLSKYPRLQRSAKRFPRSEFHILASIRKRYQVDESLFTSSGNVIFPNYHAVRLLAQKMNAQRDLKQHPQQTIRAGQLNAMGLIDEICHFMLRLYEETANPKVFERAGQRLNQVLRPDKMRETLLQFGTLFPPLDVFIGKSTLEDYLYGKTGEKPHAEVILEEMILLYFANFNPAFAPFRELFDDKDLKERTAYSQVLTELEKIFRTEKGFGPQNQTIFDLLRAPILASPNSLEGQLEYIKKHWGLILSDKFLIKILGAGDFIKEDAKLIFPGGPASPPVPRYTYDELKGAGLLDFERFTSDLDWMPNVVLLAKNTHVWLDQLSKKYKRSITKLNEIPDEELDQLARWNFTALWFIGIWERSSASQKIKQGTGNPEAVASAYSLYDYTIANDLGGEDAFQNLRDRAWQRGIRLAGDMVPNHVGIYSKWIIEQPDYFIQSTDPPFPNYRFTGENLSEHPDVEIRIEDGYWNRTDAAVVFQRIDKRTGNVRYIYHGNDGTRMPWNDTAQLDFLKAEVREAVIQTIFHVARKFSIIRFDAAMTLTKRHFQRLWYPQPGSGGDIPSRVDHALPAGEFDHLFPNEFWREVVDLINQEMPNTLLLAEAFWLLEGYFVRTLGMHRVYNSAFMHMIMKEENAKYRELIRNTMHYNPEILKRYVNFMSNPDEQTVIAQFGMDDKYFGAALLMVTLPGLPMFAHGQIEGYAEKYGMEYRRAYSNEDPDRHLVRRHEQEIFPLLGKRHLFSQVTNFELYDFVDTHGRLNEDVITYSNKSGNERVLICYHNRYKETAGWIKTSVGRNMASTDHPKIISRTLGEALGFSSQEKVYYIFKDYKTQGEFIRSGKELAERGLYVELKAFQYHVFLDFREVVDAAGDYERLANHLQGRSVPDIQASLNDFRLTPFHQKMQALLNRDVAVIFIHVCLSGRKKLKSSGQQRNRLVRIFHDFVEQARMFTPLPADTKTMSEDFKQGLHAIQQIYRPLNDGIERGDFLIDFSGKSRPNALLLLSWMFASRLHPTQNLQIFDELRLSKAFEDIFKQADFTEEERRDGLNLLKILVAGNIFSETSRQHLGHALRELLDRDEVKVFIKMNYYNGVSYYNKERFEELMSWQWTAACIQILQPTKNKDGAAARTIKEMSAGFQKILQVSDESQYQLERLKNNLLPIEK